MTTSQPRSQAPVWGGDVLLAPASWSLSLLHQLPSVLLRPEADTSIAGGVSHRIVGPVRSPGRRPTQIGDPWCRPPGYCGLGFGCRGLTAPAVLVSASGLSEPGVDALQCSPSPGRALQYKPDAQARVYEAPLASASGSYCGGKNWNTDLCNRLPGEGEVMAETLGEFHYGKKFRYGETA